MEKEKTSQNSQEQLPLKLTNMYQEIVIDKKSRIKIPAKMITLLKNSLNQKDNEEIYVLVCWTNNGFYIIVDEKKKQKILESKIENMPFYSTEKIDSFDRINVGHIVKNMSQNSPKNRAYCRFHNGLISIVFDKEVAEKENTRLQNNTEEFLQNLEVQEKTHLRYSTIINGNPPMTFSYNPPIIFPNKK
ncbi:hypothetical protein KGV55_00670 [Candidatus Gracilibacteria bacterium]|nr:hypothetical protein [Candidatus Gracilibacteria bacterium]